MNITKDRNSTTKPDAMTMNIWVLRNTKDLENHTDQINSLFVQTFLTIPWMILRHCTNSASKN